MFRYGILLTAVIAFLLIFQPAWAQKLTDSELEKINDDLRIELFYSAFKPVKWFAVMCWAEGTAKELGLKPKDLNDSAKLRLRNRIADVNFMNPIKLPKILTDRIRKTVDDSVAVVQFRIWTVGDDYPVAYYAKISCSILSNASREIYSYELLGICSKDTLSQVVKECFDDLVENFAIAFYKGQKKM